MAAGSKIAGLDLQSGMRQATAVLNASKGGAFFRMRKFPGAPVVAEDTFAGVDGSSLTGRRPTFSDRGALWQQITPNGTAPVTNTVTIQGGQAAIGTSANGAAVDCALTDVDMQCDLVMGTGTRCGFIVRGVNNGNMIVVRVRDVESLIEITDWTGGVVSTIGTSQALTSTPGQTYTFRIRAEGTRVTVWRDGVRVVDEANVTAHQTGTRCGFTSFGSSLDERYDNFRVGPISSGTPVPP